MHFFKSNEQTPPAISSNDYVSCDLLGSLPSGEDVLFSPLRDGSHSSEVLEVLGTSRKALAALLEGKLKEVPAFVGQLAPDIYTALLTTTFVAPNEGGKSKINAYHAAQAYFDELFNTLKKQHPNRLIGSINKRVKDRAAVEQLVQWLNGNGHQQEGEKLRNAHQKALQAKKELKLYSQDLKICEHYLNQLRQPSFPLGSQCLIAYARLTQKTVYIWQMSPTNSQILLLDTYCISDSAEPIHLCFNKENHLAILHLSLNAAAQPFSMQFLDDHEGKGKEKEPEAQQELSLSPESILSSPVQPPWLLMLALTAARLGNKGLLEVLLDLEHTQRMLYVKAVQKIQLQEQAIDRRIQVYRGQLTILGQYKNKLIPSIPELNRALAGQIKEDEQQLIAIFKERQKDNEISDDLFAVQTNPAILKFKEQLTHEFNSYGFAPVATEAEIKALRKRLIADYKIYQSRYDSLQKRKNAIGKSMSQLVERRTELAREYIFGSFPEEDGATCQQRVEELFRFPLPINYQATDSGDTLAHVAAREGHYDLLAFLVQHGINLNLRNGDNLTVTQLLAQREDIEAVNELFILGVDLRSALSTEGPRGDTLLHHAVRGGEPYYGLTMHLLELGASLFHRNHHQHTPWQLLALQQARTDASEKEKKTRTKFTQALLHILLDRERDPSMPQMSGFQQEVLRRLEQEIQELERAERESTIWLQRNRFWFQRWFKGIRIELVAAMEETQGKVMAAHACVDELKRTWIDAYVQEDELVLYEGIMAQEQNQALAFRSAFKKDIGDYRARAERDITYSPGTVSRIRDLERSKEEERRLKEEERRLKEEAMLHEEEERRLKEEAMLREKVAMLRIAYLESQLASIRQESHEQATSKSAENASTSGFVGAVEVGTVEVIQPGTSSSSTFFRPLTGTRDETVRTVSSEPSTSTSSHSAKG